MVQHLTSLFNGLARTVSARTGKKSKLDAGREAADAFAKEAKKRERIFTSSGFIDCIHSPNLASIYSKGGGKGINQDRFAVWEEFGSQEDMIFCGIFDGHGPWGHHVARRVRNLMPPSLLYNWRRTLDFDLLNLEGCSGLDETSQKFEIWKQSYFQACSSIDHELAQNSGIDSFYSGTTALTVLRQGDLMIVANIGDSRAVLATISDDGCLVPVQLTVDLKPNLPQESERIRMSKGNVFSCDDEPGVYRVWMPKGERQAGPGLAISRAFGDYYLKDFGLISEPVLTQRYITSRDQFAVLATDGVWDVISNKEAVEIVSSTTSREESAKRLVEYAASAWKRKRKGIPMDDISAICLFFHA